MKNVNNYLYFLLGDMGICFIVFQVVSFFKVFCDWILVIYDGIDIEVVKFNFDVVFELLDGGQVICKDQIVIFVN